jgi:hypothetical protein
MSVRQSVQTRRPRAVRRTRKRAAPTGVSRGPVVTILRMARRLLPPTSPFPEFDDNEELVGWPPDHIYGFGLDAAALDAAVGWLDFGDARSSLAKVRALVAPLTEDGSHIAVANPSGQIGCFTADRWASILFVTRRSQQVRHRDVVEYAARGRDVVKVIGSESLHFCTAYVGLAFSISGNDPVYPPLSLLPFDGCPFHPYCTKRFVPFNPRTARPAELERAVVPEEDSSMFDRGADPPNRLEAARRRVARLQAVPLGDVI